MKGAMIMMLALLAIAGCVARQPCDDSNPCTSDTGSLFGCTHADMEGSTAGCDAIVPPCRQQSCHAGSCTLANITGCCGNGACEQNEDIRNCPADCAMAVKLRCQSESPLVPILLKLENRLGQEPVSCSITSDKAMNAVFVAEVPGWSYNYTTSVSLEPGVPAKVPVTFGWKDAFYRNTEAVDASIVFKVEGSGLTLASQTQSVRISPKEDIFWSLQNGSGYIPLDYSLVAWVTPHDACVQSLISSAKELSPGRSLGGYAGYGSLSDDEKANRTMEQAKAVFYAIKGQGVSYVSTPVSFSGSQHVRMPADSLAERSGNCVDGSVLFASAFEALGMNPVLVEIPGHMFMGVETFDGSGRYLFIETTMAGSGGFEEAANEGSGEYNRFKGGGNISAIYVKEKRGEVTPFPSYTKCNLNSTCADGTLAGHCSPTKPMLCVGAGLVEAASVCGCDTGYASSGDKCHSQIVKNETFVLGHSGGSRYYFWGPGYGTQKKYEFRYIVKSDQPLEIRVFPSRGDYEIYSGTGGSSGTYYSYPSYNADNALAYDQLVIHEGTGGIGLMNAAKSDANVNIVVMSMG